MTNDGDIVNKILPETIMKRIYGNSKQSPLQNVSLKEWEMEYPF
jgi:hypothetical protein